jgi:hypothetical protein
MPEKERPQISLPDFIKMGNEKSQETEQDQENNNEYVSHR